MMYTICTTPRLELAKLALSKRLYVGGFALKNLLLDMVEKGTPHRIAMAFYRDVPVGMALIVNRSYGVQRQKAPLVMVYVRRKFRRKGMGRRLVDHLCERYRIRRENLTYMAGLAGSTSFFANLQIPRATSVYLPLRRFVKPASPFAKPNLIKADVDYSILSD